MEPSYEIPLGEEVTYTLYWGDPLAIDLELNRTTDAFDGIEPGNLTVKLMENPLPGIVIFEDLGNVVSAKDGFISIILHANGTEAQ